MMGSLKQEQGRLVVKAEKAAAYPVFHLVIIIFFFLRKKKNFGYTYPHSTQELTLRCYVINALSQFELRSMRRDKAVSKQPTWCSLRCNAYRLALH